MSDEKVRPRFPKYPKPYGFDPEPVFPEGHKSAGQPRCTAWSKGSGRQCSNRPEHARTKCRLHGGLTPRGPANANYKHGEYSKSIPTRIALHYEAARKDPDLISLKEENAVLVARINDLFTTLRKEGDSATTWKKLKVAVYRWRSTKDPAQKALYLSEIIDNIEEGSRQADIWNDLYTALNMRDRMVKTESKRRVMYGHTMNIEEVWSLLGKVLSIIKEFVDADKFSKIGREFERLVLSRTGEESDRGRIGSFLPTPRLAGNDISEAVEVTGETPTDD